MADGAPRAARVCHRAHGLHQPQPQPAQRVGIVLPIKAEVVRRKARKQLEDLPGFAKLVIGDLLSEVASGW